MAILLFSGLFAANIMACWLLRWQYQTKMAEMQKQVARLEVCLKNSQAYTTELQGRINWLKREASPLPDPDVDSYLLWPSGDSGLLCLGRTYLN